jgi:hypothetical protein
MGLDATVYCDCYETGRARKPAPQPELVYVDDTGQVCLTWDAPDADQSAFYDWLKGACEHGPMGELVSHRLGNMARVGFLRSVLSDFAEQFPVLLTKVVYNGTHAGDSLSLDDIERLQSEVERLRQLRPRDQTADVIVREFEGQMSELVGAALRVRKPIVF